MFELKAGFNMITKGYWYTIEIGFKDVITEFFVKFRNFFNKVPTVKSIIAVDTNEPGLNFAW